MKELILVILVIVLTVGIVYIIQDIYKQFVENLNAKRLFLTAIMIIIASLIGTYIIACIFKNFDIIVPVGSADAWIGFAGSAMGGLITMLALYFTLTQNQEMAQKQHIASLKPYVSCDIVNLSKEEMKIQMDSYIEEYDFIKCRMKNISNNIANGIRIVDEYSLVENSDGDVERVDDLLDIVGISIYTVCMNEGMFLAPQDEYNWKTNFCVELNEDGKYKWDGPAFCFKHIVVFELEDAENAQKYRHSFQYELNINVDTDNKLHFFLWDMSNSLVAYDEVRRKKLDKMF